jgi:hypothetical protein
MNPACPSTPLRPRGRAALFTDASPSAAPAPPSDPALRSLLLSLGLPLACGLPPAAEAALLRAVPGAAAASPAAVRAHLANALRAAGGGAAFVRQVALAAGAAAAALAADGKAGAVTAAAVAPAQAGGTGGAGGPARADAVGSLAWALSRLLAYCLADVASPPWASASTSAVQQPAGGVGGGGGGGAGAAEAAERERQRLTGIARELDGLPLLPLADGGAGTLQALSPPPPSRGAPPAPAPVDPEAAAEAAVAAAAALAARLPGGALLYVLPRGPAEEALLEPPELRARALAPGLPAALLEAVDTVGADGRTDGWWLVLLLSGAVRPSPRSTPSPPSSDLCSLPFALLLARLPRWRRCRH